MHLYYNTEMIILQLYNHIFCRNFQGLIIFNKNEEIIIIDFDKNVFLPFSKNDNFTRNKTKVM